MSFADDLEAKVAAQGYDELVPTRDRHGAPDYETVHRDGIRPSKDKTMTKVGNQKFMQDVADALGLDPKQVRRIVIDLDAATMIPKATVYTIISGEQQRAIVDLIEQGNVSDDATCCEGESDVCRGL